MTVVLEHPAIELKSTSAEQPRIVLPDSAVMPRRQWTLEECRQLMAMGLLEEGGRYELLEGEIVDKMSFNEPHVYVASQVYRALMAIFGLDFLRLAAPVALAPRNGPEPDVAVMMRPLRDYLSLGTPPPADVRLAVEVADATLHSDRSIKSLLYSLANIPEYWIVNIPQAQVEVFRQPTSEGYTDRTVVARSGILSPLAAPIARISVADLLP